MYVVLRKKSVKLTALEPFKMLFKYLFTVWFLVFVLMSGGAVAYAGHDDTNPSSTLEIPLDKNCQQPWQIDCGDHCCHTVAHVVGLIDKEFSPATAGAFSAKLSQVDNLPYSLPLAPPYHPPIT